MTPLTERPLVRAGAYAWAIVGVVLVLVGAAIVLGQLKIVVVPLLLALFPAALLSPVVRWLRARGVPPALAALGVLICAVLLVAGVGLLLAPSIAAEAPRLAQSLREGADELQRFLERGPLELDQARIDELIAQGRAAFEQGMRRSGLRVATAVAEGLAGLLLGIVVLFFYLKDGERIAAWLRDLFPERARGDAQAIGQRSWETLGAYFRGQLFIALVDAVFIGLGLVLLGVPLALALSVLIFFGGLFPIVGALVSGAVAVLVALAASGPLIALAVLGVVIGVQQVESNLLAPIVLGKATELHPLAVITALTAGAIVLGVLGAFLAVPIAASVAKGVGHLRLRVPG